MLFQIVMSAQLFCVQLFHLIIIIIIIIVFKSAWNMMLVTLTTRVFLFCK